MIGIKYYPTTEEKIASFIVMFLRVISTVALMAAGCVFITFLMQPHIEPAIILSGLWCLGIFYIVT
jgi:hypothetical protein